jgi:hypothetical protein
MGDFILQDDIDWALKIKACHEEVGMTNEELIKRFFSGRVKGDEESYGFSIKPNLRENVGNFALYSKTNRFPMAVKVSNTLFIITPKSAVSLSTKITHNTLVLKTALQMGVGLIFSPKVDKANFQGFMEGKINRMLSALAHSLYCHRRDWNFVFVPKYKKLLEDIRALHDGEILLGLPKNQVALLDTSAVQNLWAWLIKENPNKEDRELLRKTYMLSRLLAPQQSRSITFHEVVRSKADDFVEIHWK